MESETKKFRVTIEGDAIILPKSVKPNCNHVIPVFNLRDAVTISEDENDDSFLFIDSIKMERIE